MATSTSFDFGRLDPRSVRARESYRPCTWRRRMLSRVSEGMVAHKLKGVRQKTKDPLDVICGRVGIEVKTLIDPRPGTRQISVHKDCRLRKLRLAEEQKLVLMTVVLDYRNGDPPKVYFRWGVHSYCIRNLQPVTWIRLKEMIDERNTSK